MAVMTVTRTCAECRTAAALAIGLGVLAAGCGAVGAGAARRPAGGTPPRIDGAPAALLAELRPIGRGPRFQPPLRGSVQGRCTPTLGRRLEAHVEVFGANRVVLLAAGIGTRAPRRLELARVVRARCFGDAVTLDPTGIVYFRPGPTITVGDVFHAWGQPLSATRIASFTGGRVRVYVNGRRWRGVAASLTLRDHAEIVLEVGPHVPPHASFTFPPDPTTSMR